MSELILNGVVQDDFGATINGVGGGRIINGVVQGHSLPFICKVIVGADTTFALPLEASGSYDCVVDWGDTSSSTITTWDQAEVDHTYSGAGTYTISITGTLNGWRFNGVGDRLKIVEISQWGVLMLGNSGDYFYNCVNLTITAIDNLNLSDTTTLNALFRGCSSIVTIPSFTSWDFSTITVADRVFFDATSFNQDIDGVDLSNATNLERFLSGATSFDQEIGNIKITAVTNMANFLLGVAMSTENWSNTLIGFDGQSHQDNVVCHGGTSTRNPDGTVAYNALLVDGWTITDGGAA